MAQNNAIFSGGSKDGHDRGCYMQLSNLNTALSKGGNGDGHSRDCYMQTSNLNLTLSKGGSGDGHSVDCYTQTSNLNMTLSAGGSGDGHSKDCYMQTSNLNNIFSGGIGGDGMLNGCANEPLGCTLAVNLGNDTTFCDGPTLTLNAGSFPGGATYLWQDNSTAQTFVVDTSGVYYVNVTDTAGCNGIDTIVVTVTPMPVVNLGNDTAFCAGNNLVLNAGNGGATYLWQNTTTPPFQNQTLTVNATGTYFVVATYGICSDTDSVVVTVNPIITTNLANSIVCQGDSALIFGVYRSLAGTYRDTIVSSSNCDSILVQQLIVNPTYNNNLGTVNVCSGDSALIFGNYQTIAGVYYDSLTTINGCDSIVYQTLNVITTSGVNLGNDTAICAGTSLVLDAGSGGNAYLWQNNPTPPFQNQTLTVSSAGQYFVQVTFGSCSSSDTINVTVNPVVTTTLVNSIVCQGDSALIFGTYQSVAGTYRDTILASTGCDSILVKQLIVNPTFNNNLGTVAVCLGDSALIHGTYQTVAGIYYDSLTTINGCDSIVSQTLVVNPIHIVNLGADTTICANDNLVLDAGAGASSYQWQGNITLPYQNQTLAVTNGGQYYVIATLGSCSTSDTINIMVNPLNTTTLSPVKICQGDSALIFGVYQTVAGTYQDTVSATVGCDTIVSQQLIFHNPYALNLGNDTLICETDSIILDAGNNFSSFIWNTGDTTQTILVDGNTLVTGFHTYYVQAQDTNGCMSTDTIVIEVAICSGVEELTQYGFNLYPNPTKGEFTLQSENTILSVEIYSIIGEKVMDRKLASKTAQFNISHLTKGIYVVKILYDEGSTITRVILD
jgi:hypothetical protein